MSILCKIEEAERLGYDFSYWREFDYSRLQVVSDQIRIGSKKKERYNDCIIMADTETSKERPEEIYHNHVVAWTISIRAYRMNLCTLYGHRPDTMIDCIDKIHELLPGDHTIIFFHNMSYDYTFLRRFMFEKWGYPEKQLNTKPHYPIIIEFENGIIFRDSLILAQRSLDKWAKDMNVDHQKAVGLWDYDKIRNQKEDFTPEELEYIEHDTLAGVECLDALRYNLKKHSYSIPYTATGIPREECIKIGKKNRAKDLFNRHAPTYEQQMKLEMCFHGGYTHANRHIIGTTVTPDYLGEELGYIQAFDYASRYPAELIAKKFPMENFHSIGSKRPEEILDMEEEYAFMFKLILTKFRLKDDLIPMPVLQFSKCTKTVNVIIDNGRLLCGAYIEIYITEHDLAVIVDQYDYELAACVEVECAHKDYLPKWFRDYTFKLFEDKSMLKGGGDPVSYALAKAKLNSLFGMCVQRPCRETITEDYKTGEYIVSDLPSEEGYNTFLKNHNKILLYQWGVWVTSGAMRELFKLGSCIRPDGLWCYSDTDSCYALGWDYDKVRAYNDHFKDLIRKSGYGAVIKDGREYWLGIAESEGDKDKYSEFRTLGAKRYCGRCVADGELHITVAGVPKKGAVCLNNDIENFRQGLIFDGIRTGKKTHSYFYSEIQEDDNGNIRGDSIDLSPCDYLLDAVETYDWEKIFSQEIQIQTYEEE